MNAFQNMYDYLTCKGKTEKLVLVFHFLSKKLYSDQKLIALPKRAFNEKIFKIDLEKHQLLNVYI